MKNINYLTERRRTVAAAGGVPGESGGERSTLARKPDPTPAHLAAHETEFGDTAFASVHR